MSGSTTETQAEEESATESTSVVSHCEEKDKCKNNDSESKEPSTSEEFEVIEPLNSTSKEDTVSHQVVDISNS